MKIGWSILEQRFIPAEDVETGDCIRFQVVCPSCKEAVFKVDRAGGERRYLAHYRRNKALNDQCELRVNAIPKQVISQANSQSRGQHLRLFLSVLRDALAKVLLQDQTAADIPGIVNHMVGRPSYRELVRRVRDRLGGGYKEELWHFVEQLYADQSPYWRERQFAYARDVMEHLLAPNSFQNFAFAISIGGMKATLRRLYDADVPEDARESLRALFMGTDRDLRREIQKRSRGMLEAVTASWTSALMALLVHIPYIDILAQQHGKVIEMRQWINLLRL